jgi:anti-sigma regulatory factor (Ser/Thr protein kinase)
MRHLSGPIDVRVPAHPESLRILRAVASSVAARLDLRLDAIEELRIAVDEAATILLRSAPGPGDLHLRLEPDGAVLRIDVSLAHAAPSWPPDDLTKGWAWIVIAGLMDQPELANPGVPTVRFHTPTQPVDHQDAR